MPKIYDLSRGAPLLSTVPWKHIVGQEPAFPGINQVVEENLKTLLYKGSDSAGHNFKGYCPFREHLAQKHGVDVDQIILRNGGMDVMTHVLKFLLWEREKSENPKADIAVLTEIPTYDRFPLNLEIHGIGWKGIAISHGGLDLEEFENMVSQKEVRLFYGIYEGQNPSSFSYTDEQMRAVENICRKYGKMVLWDGAYHHLTYGRLRETISSPSENVILQYNYTKEISAGLKCGYLVIPKSLTSQFDHIVCNTGLNPNYPTQAWIHAFVTSPHYQAHLQSLRDIFAPRAKAVITAIEQYSPDAQWNKNLDSGYFIEVGYSHISDHPAFLSALEKKGVIVSDSSLSYTPELQHLAKGKIRIPFATLEVEEINEVCRLLSEVHGEVRGS